MKVATGALVVILSSCGCTALDNGLRLPPMGWSSWYGFTQNINQSMIEAMADGMVESGLEAVGYQHIWLDDGWAIGRDNKTGHVLEDRVMFPSGMGNLSAYMHNKGLKFGIYTSKGPKTCLGYQKTQPDRPGSCGFEHVDADVYANEWKVDQVKDDGCGACPQHEPFAAMRDALNKTGREIFYAIHSGTVPGDPNATVANSWRTGGDLSSSSFDMWTNRLDLATTDTQRALAGPGAFPQPDFLEVGYSPRNPAGNARVQSILEQRSMFTMWAVLPAPLILSADLRKGRGGLPADVMEILTNKEVISVNQDWLVQPIQPVRRWAEGDGAEVWKKPIHNPAKAAGAAGAAGAGGSLAIVLFHRNSTGMITPPPVPPAPPPTPTSPTHAGSPLTLIPCSSSQRASFELPVDRKPGPIAIKPMTYTLSSEEAQDSMHAWRLEQAVDGVPADDAAQLCLGAVGSAICANPSTTPLMGAAACNAADSTQLWSVQGEYLINVGHPGHGHFDLNAGPTCSANKVAELLLYPRQNHSNEQWTFSTPASSISTGQRCLGFGSPPGPAPSPPAPPPPPPPPRVITVSWAELGVPLTQQYEVRDLWAKATLGVYAGAFNRTVAYHEAALFTFTPK